ncbi:WD repeat-containing protein [Drosera capensis]
MYFNFRLLVVNRMENMQYADELVREFIVFRGFTSTLQVFESELNTDLGKGFQVEKILDLIFSEYAVKFQAGKLVGLLSFLRHCFSSSEMVLTSTLSKLEDSIFRYYIVHAVRSGRKDKVVEFFGMMGSELRQKGEEWTPWFGITYSKSPSTEPQFRVFFSKEWFDALRLSISSEKNTVSHLRRDIKQLNLKFSQLQALLEEREKLLQQLKRSQSSSKYELSGASATASGLSYESVIHNEHFREHRSPNASSSVEDVRLPNIVQTDASGSLPAANTYDANFISISSMSPTVRDDSDARGGQVSEHCTHNGEETVAQGNEEFSEVRVNSQETFLGHTSPISRSRFSASGNNIASASVDGTVRIWAYGSSSPTRNATIYCGAEILSLDWECKSDRLLLIGTADGGIKAWNVDAKRVVCDLSTAQMFPRVLDIKSSPVEPIFVSAAASEGNGPNGDTTGFASLTAWNMRTWKAMTVLPLGEDPPAITALSFNHNGKILAASAVDGMIHMFDMSAGLQITGWPAHDSAISSILFGPDETSIFSLGSDGKANFRVELTKSRSSSLVSRLQ